MKLACASGAFDRLLSCGDLTQIEFLELCAREFACDGVVLDVRHFPRDDDDYLAQVKKMAADRGLCVAAVREDDAATDLSRAHAALRIAVSTGAPLLALALPPETALPWDTLLDRLCTVAKAAKTANVTLALRNRTETRAASSADLRRVLKETDSAWLRLGPAVAELGPADDLAALASRVVMLWAPAVVPQPRETARLLEAFGDFRGHLVLDDPAGAARREDVASAVAVWRAALAAR
jgi:hypothetical protein